MSASIWTGDISSDWADPGNWSPAGVPDASSDVVISIGDAVASASIGTMDSMLGVLRSRQIRAHFHASSHADSHASMIIRTGSRDSTGGARTFQRGKSMKQ